MLKESFREQRVLKKDVGKGCGCVQVRGNDTEQQQGMFHNLSPVVVNSVVLKLKEEKGEGGG